MFLVNWIDPAGRKRKIQEESKDRRPTDVSADLRWIEDHRENWSGRSCVRDVRDRRTRDTHVRHESVLRACTSFDTFTRYK